MRRLAAAAAALVALAAAVAGAANPASACACGMALDAEVSAERALVVDQPGYEEIVLSLDLESEGSGRAAVVLPVPGDPEVRAIATGDPLAYLDQATAPEPEPGSEDGAAGAGVDLLGRETVGGYDVSRLAAADPQALSDWLDRNRYTLPAGAEPILADYVDEGWRYVAIRLAPGSDGRLRPLRIGFPTDEPVYPMRLSQLGAEPLTVTLYALADGPREVEGLETRWSGSVSELDPQPPPELAELFAQGSYVTRMQIDAADPASFDEDLKIDDAGSEGGAADEPVGFGGEAADAGDEGREDDGDELSIVAVVLILAAAASALAGAVAYRAHRDD